MAVLKSSSGIVKCEWTSVVGGRIGGVCGDWVAWVEHAEYHHKGSMKVERGVGFVKRDGEVVVWISALFGHD